MTVATPPVPMPPAASAEEEEEEGEAGAADVTGQVDIRGFPWDKRIHSGNKQKKADGTWNKRRGTRDSETAEVEAELRAQGFGQPQPAAAAPAPVAPAPAPLPPLAPATAPVVDPVAAQAAYAATAALPAPAAPVPPAPVAPLAAPVPSARDFNGVLTRISTGVKAGKIDQTFINQHIIGAINAIPQFNVQMNAVTDMQNRPEVVEYTHQILDVNNI